MALQFSSVGFDSHQTYSDSMQEVEQRRDEMIQFLSEWVGVDVQTVIEHLAANMRQHRGMTFDESLDAVYGWHHIDFIWSKERAASA